MKEPIFTGTATALVTPFHENKLNFSMLEKLLHRQLKAQIDGIVLCGTTGEAPTLSDKEKIEILHFAKEYVSESCRLIAGTGSNDTAHALELSLAAQECGMDALLIVTPYYNKATAAGLVKHYSVIAEAVSVPVILYNVPSRTGVNIPIEVYEELSHIPNINGVKEASGNLQTMMKIRQKCSEDFYVWSGNDDLTVPMMVMGGKGVISVASNILPEKVKEMTDAALQNDYASAAKLQNMLLPLINTLFCEVNPIPVKEAMRLIGLDCGMCRLPLCQLSEINRKKLTDLLKN